MGADLFVSRWEGAKNKTRDTRKRITEKWEIKHKGSKGA